MLDSAAADGLMLFGNFIAAADFERFSRLKAIVRLGAGYDRIDRDAAAAHGVTVCDVPDYCTTDIADQARTLAIGLRRGIFLHHEAQRRPELAPWAPVQDPPFRRMSAQTFAAVRLGRVGTSAALRAKAFGFCVLFCDPCVPPHGFEVSLHIERAAALDALLPKDYILSIPTTPTQETRGMIGAAQLERLPAGAIVLNTARGPALDVEALGKLIRSDRVVGAGLDVPAHQAAAGTRPGLSRPRKLGGRPGSHLASCRLLPAGCRSGSAKARRRNPPLHLVRGSPRTSSPTAA